MRRFTRPRCFLPCLIIYCSAVIGCASLSPEPTFAPALVSAPQFTPEPTVTRTRTFTPTPTRTRTLAASPTPRCLGGTAINPATARSERIDTKIKSELLGKELPILIYLPPGYGETRLCYPVLYMLHGYGGPYTEWERLGLLRNADVMMRRGEIQPMIIVLPEGERSWWFNHAPPSPACPQSDGKRWGDYVWREVVAFTDSRYRTLGQRESRAVGGLSLGGQAALMLGMTHPEVFGIVGAHSPSFRGADGSIPDFCTPEYFNQYDPIWLVNNTEHARQLNLSLDMGEDDGVWGPAILQYRQLLVSRGIQHRWRLLYGGHDVNYWTTHAPEYLNWYSSQLAGQ